MKTFIFSFIISVLFLGCDKNNTALTPARQLAGNWTTPNPVTFYYSSEGCGGYARYSSFPMKVNWQITAVGDSSVSITWTLVSSGSQSTIGNNCGLPCPSLAFPLEFVGVISGSKFALDEHQSIGNVLVGIFNFTTDNITGTMTEKDCPVYCSGYSTDANTFILTRVN